MSELKSCPFCGSRAILHERTDGFYVDCASQFGICKVLPATWIYKTEEEAIDAWNRRVGDE